MLIYNGFIVASYMDRHKILLILSKRIYRTAHTGRTAVEDVGETGESAGAAPTARAYGVMTTWVEMLLSGDLVPVTALPPTKFETFGENLGTGAADRRIRWNVGSHNHHQAYLSIIFRCRFSDAGQLAMRRKLW